MSDFAKDKNVLTKSRKYKQQSACEETCLRMVRYCKNCSGENRGDGMSEEKTLKEIALALLEKYRTVAEALIYENSGRITEDLMETDCEYGWIRKQIEKVAEPKWIPVTRRLPEEKVEVLVTVEVDGKKYIESGMLTSINHGQWETIYDRYVIDVYGRNRNSKVIAWIPLPTPWKGEENDK